MGARKFAWLGDVRLDREWDGGGFRVVPKLDLFHPGAVDLIASLFAALARQAVAGILIQDHLTLRREGFSAWDSRLHPRQRPDADPRRMLAPGTAQQRAWEAVKVACVGEAPGASPAPAAPPGRGSPSA